MAAPDTPDEHIKKPSISDAARLELEALAAELAERKEKERDQREQETGDSNGTHQDDPHDRSETS